MVTYEGSLTQPGCQVYGFITLVELTQLSQMFPAVFSSLILCVYNFTTHGDCVVHYCGVMIDILQEDISCEEQLKMILRHVSSFPNL